MKKVISAICIILVLAFVGLYIYVTEITVSRPIKEGIYFTADNEYAACFEIHADKTAEVYLFTLEDNSPRIGIKMEMKCGYDWLNPFFGDYYFRTDSLLSLRKIDVGGDPAYLKMKCKEVVCFDFLWYSEHDASEAVNEYSEPMPFAFCDDNSIYLDGGYVPKVMDYPEQLKYYVDYLDNLMEKHGQE